MLINNNIISLDVVSPGEMARILADNVKKRRLELNLTQEGLSSRSGVKLPTYRKFEKTGEISLINLLRLASALDTIDEFKQLFTQKKYETLDDVINEKKISKRKRGRKK